MYRVESLFSGFSLSNSCKAGGGEKETNRVVHLPSKDICTSPKERSSPFGPRDFCPSRHERLHSHICNVEGRKAIGNHNYRRELRDRLTWHERTC